MWSGSLLTNYSGALTGAHQRIDRLAFRYIRAQDSRRIFPKLKDILHFEGKNGPDGIKAKSPAQDEPWHYFNPYNKADSDVINFINSLSKNGTRNSKPCAAVVLSARKTSYIYKFPINLIDSE